jgi:hypothetical protein
MKLGIAIVYMVSEKYSRLLDIHLDRIRRHTTVPYTIYASVNRLQHRFRQRLEQDPHVRIIDSPTTQMRGSEEHSYYLEHLILAAINEGATHIVTFHVDSFPIRLGWAEEMADKLSDTCALITLEHVNTAFLFFSREFYLRFRPKLMLTEMDRRSPSFPRYLREHKPIQHSGTGYCFKAFSEGFSCCYLCSDSPKEAGQNSLFDEEGPLGVVELDTKYVFAVTYDHTVFHLKGAVRLGDKGTKAEAMKPYMNLRIKAFVVIQKIWRTTPLWLHSLMKPILFRPYKQILMEPFEQATLSKFEAEISAFMEDPDGYLEELLSIRR